MNFYKLVLYEVTSQNISSPNKRLYYYETEFLSRQLAP